MTAYTDVLPDDWPAPRLRARCARGHQVAGVWTRDGHTVWLSAVVAEQGGALADLAADLRRVGQLLPGSGRPAVPVDTFVGTIDADGTPELPAYCSKCRASSTFDRGAVLDALDTGGRDVMPAR